MFLLKITFQNILDAGQISFFAFTKMIDSQDYVQL